MPTKSKSRGASASAAALAPAGAAIPQDDARAGARHDQTSLLRLLAEELGRLLAREEMARQRKRRAYGMIELLLGLGIMATILILIARNFRGY